MIASLINLYKYPYNKIHPFFAFYRFVYWKLIRLLKLKNAPLKLWGNRKIWLNHDSFQSMNLMYHYWVDWEEFNLISRFLRPGDHVADVGANMGFYTIWMSKYISNGTIHAFEPDESNRERLKKNIKLNNIQNIVKVNACAVGNINGRVSFTTGLDGENHIVTQPSAGGTFVESETLDTYCQENNVNKFSYMKVDVEGFEYYLFLGAEKTLREKKVLVFQLEINNTIRNAGVSVNDLLGLLQKYGYKLCLYNLKKGLLEPASYSEKRENYFAISNIDEANQRLKK